jgi:hypothetical protein
VKFYKKMSYFKAANEKIIIGLDFLMQLNLKINCEIYYA